MYNYGGDGLDEKRKIPYPKTKLKEEYSSENSKLYSKEELKIIIKKSGLIKETLPYKFVVDTI